MHRIDIARNVGQGAIDLLYGIDRRDDFGLGDGQLVTGALGLLLGAHRQRTDEVGDNGEAAPGIARATGFDGRVHGQYPGLEGNLVDPFDDRIDALGAAADPGHRLHGTFRCGSAGADRRDCLIGARHRALRRGRRRPQASFDLDERRRSLLKTSGIAFGPAGQVFGCLGDLLRAVVDAMRAFVDAADQLTQPRERLVKAFLEFSILGREFGHDIRGQIALRQALHIGRHGLHGSRIERRAFAKQALRFGGFLESQHCPRHPADTILVMDEGDR